MPMAPSDVAVADRSAKPAVRIKSGTKTIPPPTPKSALKSPSTRPMATSRTGLSYGGMPTAPAYPLERLAAEQSLAGLLLDIGGVLALIVVVLFAETVPE